MNNAFSNRTQKRIEAIINQFSNSPPQGYSYTNPSIKTPIQDLINTYWDREIELHNKEYDI